MLEKDLMLPAEAEIDLRAYFSLLLKWAWLIVVMSLLSAGTALVVSLQTTPVYRTTTTLRASSPSSSAQTDVAMLNYGQRVVETYAQLLSKDTVLDGVIANLGLNMTSRRLRGAVTVKSVRSTDLIEISVENTDPAVAQAIANEIPKAFAAQDQALRESQYSQLKSSLTSQMGELEAKMTQLQQAIAEKKAAGAQADSTDLLILESDLAQARSNHATLLQNYGAVQLAETQSGGSVIVVDPAKVPEKPVRPRTRLNVLLAAVVGAMLATGVVFLMEYLDDTLKTADDVQGALGIATLALVARTPNGKGEAHQDRLLATTSTKSPFAEPYRVLRTNIRFSGVDKPIQTLMVTSPSPNEGKSTTVSNLAIVMAQAGKKVLLIEADLRKPVLHDVFGVANHQGVTNALVQTDTALDALIQQTTQENLRVITSGPLPPNPSELLDSQRMRQLVETLKEEADMLLFDSPPVMVAADASILADLVDGTLLVIDSGSTRREAAQQAIQTLIRGRARVLGAVLNNVARTKGNSYYYYHSGYYSDNGQGDGQHRSAGQGRFRGVWTRLRGNS